MEGESLPYLAEYAKSNRASCKGCLSLIAKDSLRIAIMVQSRHFDGKQPHWYHYSCFFGKCRPQSIDEIGHFHNLRWSDQQNIRTQVERIGVTGVCKTDKESVKLVTKSLQDFVIQYALSNRSSCKKCEQKIDKDEIRISHKEVDPEKPQVGLIDRWHHVGCFMKIRKELGWSDDNFTADMITGFKALDTGDRDTIKKHLDSKGKKSKKSKKVEVKAEENGSSNETCDKIMKELRAQSAFLWKVVDELKKLDLKKPELISILEENDQNVPTGIDKIYDRIADGMVFGRLQPCRECGDGQLVASSRGFYQCTGNISGWTSCNNTTRDVKRTPWIIPSDLKDNFPYLKKYKFKSKKDRVFPPTAAPKPLKNKKIVLLGKLSQTKVEATKSIENLGGFVTTSLAKGYCCISTKGEVDTRRKRIKDAEVQDIFIVSEDFLVECEKIDTPTTTLLPLLKKCSLASWGSERTCSSDGRSMKRMMEEERKSGEAKKMKLVVKSGAAVDPESEMEHSSEVVVHYGRKYTATLSMVDMKSGFNSYYKLQLLMETSGRRWHIFRSWGRVGTSIGGTKLETFRKLDGALKNFHELYLEKTGNEFGCKDFVKYPRKFYPLEIDYGDDDGSKIKSLDNAGSNSKLPQSLQQLVKLIFDIESMKKAMVEFEIDLNKMPLGKLSKRQMQMAYSVLTEATEMINVGELVGSKMIDCSNRFYTLIPHDYGMQQPPLLDNEDIIKTKTSMLDNLMDIEVAYNLLKGGKDEEKEDPLDSSYKKLNCDIKPVDRDSKEFEIVKKFTELTHANTHTQYMLTVDELFKVNRKGEHARFRPFQSLPNRKLLWHGSRTTNYAGILSQGLRIAPPEAPVTGYMFGKGIYFADMVTKSANYCGTSSANSTGLCLLADVALGNMYELTNAKNVRKLPKAKHSVKGVGSTEPDPSSHTTIEGVTVPMGKGITADLAKHGDTTSLLYNEYIVYDVAQVNLKYLVKFKFNYKSLW